MGVFTTEISNRQKEFIEQQHLFFVATAPLSKEGHINLSPKGMDSFRVLSPNKVGYMDVISSGNETSAHTLENGRITFMFCSFQGAPGILRLYGKGRAILPGTKEWDEIANNFPLLPSTRQIIVADIHKVQTSCGFGIPLYDYVEERDVYHKWANSAGPEAMEKYRDENNLISLDGLPTDLYLPRSGFVI